MPNMLISIEVLTIATYSKTYSYLQHLLVFASICVSTKLIILKCSISAMIELVKTTCAEKLLKGGQEFEKVGMYSEWGSSEVGLKKKERGEKSRCQHINLRYREYSLVLHCFNIWVSMNDFDIVIDWICRLFVLRSTNRRSKVRVDIL